MTGFKLDDLKEDDIRAVIGVLKENGYDIHRADASYRVCPEVQGKCPTNSTKVRIPVGFQNRRGFWTPDSHEAFMYSIENGSNTVAFQKSATRGWRAYFTGDDPKWRELVNDYIAKNYSNNEK